jgi:choline-sulfatase
LARLPQGKGAALFRWKTSPSWGASKCVGRRQAFPFGAEFRNDGFSKARLTTLKPSGINRACCLAACAWLAVAFGCANAIATGPQQPVPVILVSIDTLRADHLSVYGYRKIHTPNIDSFAQGGTLFTQVESQIPLTLPSHTSLFTSTYPFVNHIEENGEHVPPGTVTLASLLRARGYRTGAFIGGYFLDKSFGLDQGFDEYDSPFSFRGHMPSTALDLRRDGYWVLRQSLQWLDGNRGHPGFLFVHLFDLHRPYTLDPKPGLSGYDTELLYVDGLMGRFKRQLIERGWWDRSLVVLLSDHGEGLGDHHEVTHGYFIYQSTLRVPLIFHWPDGTANYQKQVAQPVGLIDVAPTILSFLGMAAPPSFEGRSLLSGARSDAKSPSRTIYSESVYACDAFGWSALRGVRMGKYYYIQAPHPELYDLQKDPAEQDNIYRKDHAEAQALEDQIGTLLSRFAPAHPAAPEGLSRQNLAALESLGYLSAGTATAGTDSSGIDPKDRLLEYRLYERALLSLQTGRLSDAISTFRGILRSDPKNIVARFHLGEGYLAARRPFDAVREWRATLSYQPGYAPAAQALGEYWLGTGNYPRAQARLEQAVAAAPGNSQALLELGITYEHLGEHAKALACVQSACKESRSPDCERALQTLQHKKKQAQL